MEGEYLAKCSRGVRIIIAQEGRPGPTTQSLDNGIGDSDLGSSCRRTNAETVPGEAADGNTRPCQRRPDQFYKPGLREGHALRRPLGGPHTLGWR